mgnify:CR=1 FL=1
MKVNTDMEICLAKNQIHLYGYESYFKSFVQLLEKKRLANSVLLTGQKGLGKSTFIYHLINYFLSANQNNKYSINDFLINSENHTYNLITQNIHPNFYLVENEDINRDIKIDQIRNLKKFINKSTYNQDLKIILIDNAENLNLNSANSLLKSVEEPSINTYFFIIHNNPYTILPTLKSRCNEFKIHFSMDDKKRILSKLLQQYKFDLNADKIFQNYYFETPGNLIKYLSFFHNDDFDLNKFTNESIIYLLENYSNKKNPFFLSFLKAYIMKFFNLLFISDKNNFYINSFKYSKILNHIENLKKYNLNEKITFLAIQNILNNEAR